MKKILFVSGGLGRGGAQRVITLLANEYAKKNWSVHIVTLLENEIGYKINKKIVLYDLSKKGNYMKHLFYWISNLRRLIKTEKPDVILSFTGRINIITMISAIGLHIPVAVSERNDPQHDRRNNLEISLCKFFYSKADCVVFQTNYQKEFYGKKCKENSVVIGNPICKKPYHETHTNGDIIAVGKLMEQKNHIMLIKAFSEIAKDFPDKRLHIFGDGELKDELDNLITKLEMEGRVILEGNSVNIFEKLHQYKFFVMSSNYEGLSNALLEAMMSGMTCISTEWNGVRDLISDGENGFLVPVGDIKAMKNKLEYVLKNDNSSVNKKGIETAYKYKTENIINKWYDALNSIT